MLENLTEIQEILLLQDQIQEEERTLRKLRESLGQKKDLLFKYSLFDIALIIPTITNLINQINNNDYKYKELIFPIPRSRSSYQEYFGILYNNKARSFNKEEPQFGMMFMKDIFILSIIKRVKKDLKKSFLQASLI